MPMNAYTGATGAGKTYQVMEHLICVELAQGRSIATNIEGIDLEGIYWYILCKNRNEKETIKRPDGSTFQREKIVCFGNLRHIKDEKIEEGGEKFFPYIRHENGEKIYDDSDSVIKNGEYFICDEATNWWGADCKISRRHGQFFREHRHFVNEITHESCDIVFLTQDISYLHSSLRRKGGIRYTFFIEKMDMVGLTRRYKMLMFRGCSITKNTKPERIEHGSYKEEVYLLYDSYAKGKGKEKIMDARQNVLNNSKRWRFYGVMILVFGVVAFFMVKSLMGFFNQGKKPEQEQAKAGVPASTPQGGAVPPAGPSNDSDYRAQGWYSVGNNRYVVVRSDSGSDRTLVNPRGWSLERRRYSGNLESKQVSNWTGKSGNEARRLVP